MAIRRPETELAQSWHRVGALLARNGSRPTDLLRGGGASEWCRHSGSAHRREFTPLTQVPTRLDMRDIRTQIGPVRRGSLGGVSDAPATAVVPWQTDRDARQS